MEGMGNRVNDIWMSLKRCGELDRDETSRFFVEAAMRRLFCEVYKRGLRAASIPLYKHATHYSQRSDFPIITWHSYVDVPPYLPPGDTPSSSVGLSHGIPE